MKLNLATLFVFSAATAKGFAPIATVVPTARSSRCVYEREIIQWKNEMSNTFLLLRFECLFANIIVVTMKQNFISLLEGTASPTVEKESFQRSLLAAQLANSKSNGKKAVDAPPVNIGWDSHKPVVSTL